MFYNQVVRVANKMIPCAGVGVGILRGPYGLLTPEGGPMCALLTFPGGLMCFIDIPRGPYVLY